ncbi:MAG: hypothetical protein ACI8QD_002560 [Cyclobacteriaceae bacterium]|jgi:hypothetical protein
MPLNAQNMFAQKPESNRNSNPKKGIFLATNCRKLIVFSKNYALGDWN